MSSSAASCCTCSPRASSASATSASSPTADVPLSCRFACNFSVPCRHPRPNHKPPLPRNPTRFGAVPNVVGPWWLSTDLRQPRSNSVLHPSIPESPHETTIPSSRTRCHSPLTGVVRPACSQNSRPFPTWAQTLTPTTRKLQPNHSCLRFFQPQFLSPKPLS